MLIPQTIGSQEVVLTALIDEASQHTENCKHTFGGKVLGKAKWAAITKPDNVGSCYLFMCYTDGELTDSCHESIKDAKEQAEWEYEGISKKWKNAI
jgi:hypothetical protein